MKLFFFDIDGTLAEGLTVPESTQNALEQLRNEDNLVFICTGRSVYYVREHFGQYADGFICFNGRYTLLNESVLYDCPLTEGQIKEIIEKLDRLKAGYTFFNNENSYDSGYLEGGYREFDTSDRKSTRLNSSHMPKSRMPSSAWRHTSELQSHA